MHIKNNNENIHSTIICGGGPAGIGPLICAIKNNCLNPLLEEGVVLIEKENDIGGGLLSKYNINSNTLAKVLLESFDTVGGRLLDFGK